MSAVTSSSHKDSDCARHTEPIISPSGAGGALPKIRAPQARSDSRSDCSSSQSFSCKPTNWKIPDCEAILQHLVQREFVPPSDELCHKIAHRIDLYFSDENMTMNNFLLKQVWRDREGCVNLKLVTAFEKIFELTKDYRVVAYSIHTLSKAVEVNAAGNKVRRREPLPDYDRIRASRTVLAINLPVNKDASIGDMVAMFKACGLIILWKVYKWGRPLPYNLRRFVPYHLDFSDHMLCAVIEFESAVEAVKAAEMTQCGENCSQGLHVTRLISQE